jgi:hypothetical protein
MDDTHTIPERTGQVMWSLKGGREGGERQISAAVKRAL